MLDLRAGLCLLTVLGVVAINEPGLSLPFLHSKQKLSQVLLLQSDLIGLLLLPEQDGDEVPDFCSSSLPTLACWYSALGEGVLRLSVGAYSALSGGVLRSQWGRVWFSVCCSYSSIGLCSPTRIIIRVTSSLVINVVGGVSLPTRLIHACISSRTRLL